MIVTSSDSNRRFVIVALCISGFVVVLLSQKLGVLAVTKQYGPTSWGWDKEEASQVSEVIRWIGAMLLATGLAERVAYALRPTDSTK